MSNAKSKNTSKQRTVNQAALSVHGRRNPISPYSQDGRTRSAFLQGFRVLFYSLRRRVIYLNLYKSVFVSEVGNLIPRIRYQLSKNAACRGVDLGTVFCTTPDGHLEPNTRTQNRIHSTQRMLSNHSWATAVEVEMFLAGWDEGAKWAHEYLDNSCSRRLELENP